MSRAQSGAAVALYRMRGAGCRFRGERVEALVAIGGDKANQSHRDQHDEEQKSDHCDVENGHAASPRSSALKGVIDLLLPTAAFSRSRACLIVQGSAGSRESFVVISVLTSSPFWIG